MAAQYRMEQVYLSPYPIVKRQCTRSEDSVRDSPAVRVDLDSVYFIDSRGDIAYVSSTNQSGG